MIKFHGNVTGHFHMLFLVLTNRDHIRLDCQNIGGHQDWISK